MVILNPARTKRNAVWCALLAVVAATTAARVSLLDVPLERDEGEYAYAGQLILHGVPPYAEIYNMKMPGVYAAYAVILYCFGQSHVGIHVGLLFVNAGSILLTFNLSKRLFGHVAGVASAAVFAMLSTSQSVQGIFANAEHFVILPALGGIVLLLRAGESQRRPTLLGGAVLLGVAFLMKQHAAAFILFGMLCFLVRECSRRPFALKSSVIDAIILATGILAPFSVTCFVLWRSGALEQFWFWTFDYAREYVAARSLSDALGTLKLRIPELMGKTIFLWLLAGVGLVCSFFTRRARRHALFVLGFVLFSLLAVCPGFYFRAHYFVLLLPAVAMLAGVGVASIRDLVSPHRSVIVRTIIPTLSIVGPLVYACYQQRSYFLAQSATAVSRVVYGANPFPESLEVARFIEENSSPEDRIAVVGSEPQIYFYSKRRSATGYVYVYSLMEDHAYALHMQDQMIREIEGGRPKFLIVVNVATSWLMKPQSKRRILEWVTAYGRANYHRVGIVDILPGKPTVYRWREASEGYRPRSGLWLAVFERNATTRNGVRALEQ